MGSVIPHNLIDNLFKSMTSFFMSGIALLSLNSCTLHRLDVQTQYLTREQLASFHVSTPDPLLNEPLIGQRLLIRWRLSEKEFYEGEMSLYLKVRFRNRKDQEVKFSISCNKGTYLYNIINKDYTDSGGILTYYVEIQRGSTTIASWKNPLWMELIELNCQDSEIRE